MTAGIEIVGIDLGATSGRVMLAELADGRLTMHATGRFPNIPIPLADGVHWDLPGLYRGVLDGLAVAHREARRIASIGVDSWAVDYGLLRGSSLLGLPFHYRDARSHAGVEAVHEAIDPAALFARNGLQFLHFNTLYQLAADREGGLLELADTVLLIPDLVTYWLTGERVAERTNASTTGLLGARGGEYDGEWDAALIDAAGLDAAVLPRLVDPGARIGVVRGPVREAIGAGSSAEVGSASDRSRVDALTVTAVGSHDTASAVAAVPLSDPDAAYISCGTWGLVGLERDAPVLTEAARAANFTNERAVDGRVRLLTNVTGLWLLTESIRWWQSRGESVELSALLAAAAAVHEPVTVFDANDPVFHTSGDLPSRIGAWCVERGLRAPATPAEVVRSILESLAEAFGRAVRTAGELAGVAPPAVHIVGGGAMNPLLCQLVADRVEVPVLAGPVEATAIGNVLVQAQSIGAVGERSADLRAVVHDSVEIRRFEPRWKEALR